MSYEKGLLWNAIVTTVGIYYILNGIKIHNVDKRN